MGKNLFILLIILNIKAGLFTQVQQFTVERALFSSQENDEFSPVYYQGGIVFCSNQMDNSLISFKDDQKGLFKIYFVSKKDSLEWKYPQIFAKEITSSFNDGPATFSENGNVIYYSRNNSIENSLKNISNSSNKIGIFSAELIDGKWTNIKPFPYNNLSYSLGTPAMKPNGERIYFSSDMPRGFGGMDLYYCEWQNNNWGQPINMGPKINTAKNESFPFVDKSDKLFFASDGHKGYGGKDLFYTLEVNGEWTNPVLLDSTINSAFDEYGLVTDSLFENGYFSTNRLNSDDIFRFKALSQQFTNCDSIAENNYCFTFYDEQNQFVDSTSANYQWDFGNGIVRIGKEVKHCFPGRGEYSVKLSIFDKLSGKLITNQVEYKVELEDIEQAYINSYNIGVVNKPITFSGLKSNYKDFKISEYLWNFGEGFKKAGPIISKSFKNKGDYLVNLGLISEADTLGNIRKKCVSKKIRIYNSYEELFLEKERVTDGNIKINSKGLQNKSLQIRLYFMDNLSGQQKANIKESIKVYKKQTIEFDQFGILPDSYSFLDSIVGLLKRDSDIRLEIALHTLREEIFEMKMELSEKCAQELSFYFKDREIGKQTLSCQGLGLASSIFGSFLPDNGETDGVIEFIFAKK